MQSPLSVSVVVPTLNEADQIEESLASLTLQAPPHRVCIADGGSKDNTTEIVRARFPDVRVVESAMGRADQMNAGAAEMEGDILVFLHADTTLPPDAFVKIRTALEDEGAVGGCFRTTFSAADANERSFGPLGRTAMRIWQARCWMGWHRFAFGDRAIFVRRATFEAVGGFPNQLIFEDLDFVRAIRKHGRFVFLDADVRTSARRYRARGAVRQQDIQ